MKKLLLALLVAGGIWYVYALSLFAEERFNSLTATLSPEHMLVLQRGEPLSKYGRNNDARILNTSFVPQDQDTKAEVRRLRATSPSAFYEHLIFFPTSSPEESTKYLHILAKILKNITEFKTIQYQNLKDGNIHPLYLESLVLKSRDSNVAIISDAHNEPYRISSSPLTIYSYQDMPPFGVVRSENKYYQEESSLIMTGVNYTPFVYRNITVISPGNMQFIVSGILTDKGLLLYGVAVAKIKGLAVLFKGYLENSFTSRMRGVYQWFGAKMKDEIVKLDTNEQPDSIEEPSLQ